MTQTGPKPFTPTQEKIGKVVVRAMSVVNTWVYRLSGGRIGGKFPGGAPVMLLSTIGRKSGQPRTAPLLYLREGENVVIVANEDIAAAYLEEFERRWAEAVQPEGSELGC